MIFHVPSRNTNMDDIEEYIDENAEVILLDDAPGQVVESDDDYNEPSSWYMNDNEDSRTIRNRNNGDDDSDFDSAEARYSRASDSDDENEIDKDDAILIFKEHRSPVFCCSIHPEGNICVSGGEDDRAFVWNIKTGEIIHTISDHKDTVIAARFNYDGNYLATGDMAGEIRVFKVNSAFKSVWEFSMGDMCWLKWHNASNVLMAGADSGVIYVWRIPSGDCKILPGNGQKCETADLTNDGKKLFAGYGDGVLRLWDIKNCSIIVEINSTNTVGYHTECVASVSCDPDKSLYLSGSEDGTILLSSNSGPVCKLNNPNNQTASGIECVAFCPDSNLKLAATGALNGEIAVWDISKQTLRTICEKEDPSKQDGITALKWLSNQTLICGTMSGNIIGIDALSGTIKFTCRGHVADIYDICYYNQDKIIVTASEDFHVKVFKVDI